jgi:flagellar hook protein FlgE
VVQRDHEDLLFTRAGRFELDKDGFLIEHNTRAKALVTTATEGTTTFNANDYRVFAPKATTFVNAVGSLARGGTGTFDLTNLEVLDTGGGKQTLKAHFVRDSTDTLKWNVEVTNAAGATVGQGTIAFNSDGTPADGTAPIELTIEPENQPSFTVQLKLGDAGSFSGITSTASVTQSQVTVGKRDGTQLGSLSGTAFDDRGRITLTYTNGETLTPATLLLAHFTAPDEFRSLGSGLFAAYENQRPQLSVAQTSGLGRVVGSKVEMSNVDLTQQFSDLIIIQRGFQASSQMSSVANEMLQQLLALDQGR